MRRGLHSILTAHSAFVRVLRSMACVRLTRSALQAYGPSLNTAALATFCSAFGLLARALALNELKLSHGSEVVGLFLVSLLVCLVCALGVPAQANYALALALALLPPTWLVRPRRKRINRFGCG